jgi:hypothetical protein
VFARTTNPAGADTNTDAGALARAATAVSARLEFCFREVPTPAEA